MKRFLLPIAFAVTASFAFASTQPTQPWPKVPGNGGKVAAYPWPKTPQDGKIAAYPWPKTPTDGGGKIAAYPWPKTPTDKPRIVA